MISRPDLFINWADFPSIYEFGKDTLAVHWLEYSGEGVYDYDVRIRFSVDGGNSWSEDIIPHTDGKKTEHGFVSFFQSPKNEVGMIWLDGRHMSMASDHDHGGGDMALFTSIFSNDFSQKTETMLDGKVCECCPTASWWNDDRIVLAYRNRDDDELRNVHLIEYDKGNWRELGAITDDKWKIPGCPVNGPSLAGDNQQIGILWFTAPDGQAQIKFSQSNNSGKSFSDAIILSQTTPLGRVDLSYDYSQFFGSWIEMDESAGCYLVVKIIENEKNHTNPEIYSTDISCDRGSGYPQIEVWENQMLILWTLPGETPKIAGEWINLEQN